MGLISSKTFNRLQQEEYAARTGIQVNIQHIGKNKDLIAVREKKSLREVKPGVWQKKGYLTFEDGNFTNIYDTYWNPRQKGLIPSIDSSNLPFSLLDHVAQDESILAAINGSFYFLADYAEITPQDLPYDFCVRNSKIFGLPSRDEPIIYITNGRLYSKEIKARGIIQIGKKQISWTGSRSISFKKRVSEVDAVLYNSGCCDVIRERHKKTGVQIGILNNKDIYTPHVRGVVDLIIGYDNSHNLKILDIHPGGNTHFFKGTFILQVKKDKKTYHVGEKVTPLNIDTLNLKKIQSGFTVGKRIGNTAFFTPESFNRRDARSVIAKDNNGFIHFTVFDGSKYIPGFNGVSLKDITPYFSPKNYKWAYFLDGGGSSRIIVRNREKLNFYANEFAFTKLKNGTLLWDWQKARRVASAISLRTTN